MYSHYNGSLPAIHIGTCWDVLWKFLLFAYSNSVFQFIERVSFALGLDVFSSLLVSISMNDLGSNQETVTNQLLHFLDIFNWVSILLQLLINSF